MGLIITSIILCVLTIIGVLAFCSYEEISKAWCLTGFLWLFMILFGCFTTVGANTVGIFYNPLKRRNTRRSFKRRDQDKISIR